MMPDLKTRPDAVDATDYTDDLTVTRDPDSQEPDSREPAPQEPERLGDVLGLSDASPAVDIPQASRDHGGNPAGIDVRTPTTGSSELTRGKGATGIQIGAGESGTDLQPEPPRPSTIETNE